jgi:hypothetical protein
MPAGWLFLLNLDPARADLVPGQGDDPVFEHGLKTLHVLGKHVSLFTFETEDAFQTDALPVPPRPEPRLSAAHATAIEPA